MEAFDVFNGADGPCRQFESVSGRSGSAGINHVLEAQPAAIRNAFRYQFAERTGTW
jgi:hypothetical protein